MAGVTFLPGSLGAASSVPPAPSGGSLGRKQCAFSTPGSGSQQFGTVWLAASTGFLWHFIGKGGDISFSWVGGAVMQTPALLIRQMNIHDSGNLYQPDFPEGGSFSSLPLSLFLSPSLLPSSLESWSTAIFNLQIRSYLACLLGCGHWGGDAGDGSSGGSLLYLTLGCWVPVSSTRAPNPGKLYGSEAPFELGLLVPTCPKGWQLCAASFRAGR